MRFPVGMTRHFCRNAQINFISVGIDFVNDVFLVLMCYSLIGRIFITILNKNIPNAPSILISDQCAQNAPPFLYGTDCMGPFLKNTWRMGCQKREKQLSCFSMK